MRTIKLTDREADTILAAARLWQAWIEAKPTARVSVPFDLELSLFDIADNGRHARMRLGTKEIDRICAKLGGF